MITFERGTVNSTSLVYDRHGNLVYAINIPFGERAWTAGLNSPLGKRLKGFGHDDR